MKSSWMLLVALLAVGFPVFGGKDFTIKFDNSKSKIDGSKIFIQILSVNEGSWDFKNKKWDNSTSLAKAHSQTVDKIIADGGATLTGFTGGGRVYVSIGGPTNSTFVATKTGYGIRAAIYNAKKWPNGNVFDKIEMGGDPDSIVNQTAVDFYSLPLFFQIEGGSSAGYISSRKTIIGQMDTALANSPWNELLIKDSTGKHTIGVLNPATGKMPFTNSFGSGSTILDSYIKTVLPKSSTLYVGSTKIPNQCVQAFKTDANGNVTSNDGGDTASIPADCFSTFAVFCNANVSKNSSKANLGKYNLFGAISAQILRGLSFTKNDPKYFKNYKKFPYTHDPFSKVLHSSSNSQDGKAYTMGYDDTGAEDFSSSLKRPDGKGFTITLQDCSDLNKILKLKQEGGI